MVTDSSNHCENIAIGHINKEKLYLDSIKEIIYCYDNIVCVAKKKTTNKQKYRHYPILFLY